MEFMAAQNGQSWLAMHKIETNRPKISFQEVLIIIYSRLLKKPFLMHKTVYFYFYARAL